MNMTKKINVNFSSLVGLKAELLRKQAEVNEIKQKNESINKLPQISKKKLKRNIVKDTEKDTKESIDSENVVAHKKSKLMLEAKTKLYEKLKKSRNNNDNFLVDFKNKLDESDEESIDKEINEKHPIEPQENWVEYEDCFGRTRQCLREDLPHMQKKNELIKQEIMKGNTDTNREIENKEQSIPEKEPEIEIMRRKWEEQTQKLADKMDIHYQDILFNEARTHGVGYYTFSQDADERAKQQENLANLRKETERKQKEMKEIRELKERMELNRLKAARIRQRIRAGLPAEPTEEELEAQKNKINFTNDYVKKNNDEFANNDTEKSNEKTINKLTSTENVNACEKENNNKDEDKIKVFEELLGKKKWHIMSQEEWVHKCRAQRISEFGPVYKNFISAGFYSSSSNVDEELPKNLTESITLNSVTNLSNSQSQIESIASSSSPSSHLTSNNLQDIYNNCGIYVHEQHKEIKDLNIPLPDKNISSTSDNFTYEAQQESLPRNINEDSIIAGLKYLREKFEETHSK